MPTRMANIGRKELRLTLKSELQLQRHCQNLAPIRVAQKPANGHVDDIREPALRRRAIGRSFENAVTNVTTKSVGRKSP
jgi:hypothetical protein